VKNSARLSAVVLALTVSLGPAGAQSAFAAPEKSSAAAVSSIHIDNFGRIDANYYRGAQPQGRDYADLAALGVKTVINLTSDDASADEQGMVENAGMRYLQIPMTTHAVPTVAQLAEFFKVVNDAASQPVYVHCVGGRHRTGVMTAAYRMNHDGWSSEQAFKEMKQFKFGADFLHAEFKEFVYGYPTALRAAAAAAGPMAGPLVKASGGQQ
jgi:protein tyrosine/serine phosphatase